MFNLFIFLDRNNNIKNKIRLVIEFLDADDSNIIHIIKFEKKYLFNNFFFSMLIINADNTNAVRQILPNELGCLSPKVSLYLR